MINFGHESEELEFKKTTGEMREAMIDIVAILNKHEQGVLYFGISPNGDIKGQQVVESTLRDVSRTVFESIKPQIYPQIQKITIDGRDIIEVKFSGSEKPYSAYGKYYTRVADESRELTPAELKEMMIAGETAERWEQKLTEYGLEIVDEDALKEFFRRAISCGRMPEGDFNVEALLKKLGLFKNGKLNNAGYVLFGNNAPVTLKMAVFATDEKLTFLDISRVENNIFRLVDTALAYIKKNIHWRVAINGIAREEIPEIPISALREIVINSFAHARYGTPSQHEIDIHPGKVVIYNPGEFPLNYSPEDFATGNLSSIIRNELINRVLYLCHDVESFGSGFKRVYNVCGETGIACDYIKTDFGFSFVFGRGAQAKVVTGSSIKKAQTLTKTELTIYNLLKENPNYTREDIATKINKTVRTVQRALESLKDKGYIVRIGTTRWGYWEIVRS